MPMIRSVARLCNFAFIPALVLLQPSGQRPALADAGDIPAPPACTAPFVSTTTGDFCGLTQRISDGGEVSRVRAYLGMRYGTAKRFAVSVPATPAGEVPATQLGTVCPQPNLPADAPVGEDCLFLDVWVPASPSFAPRPVLMFIHGGAFDVGASSQAVFMGGRLAAQGDVIVVTINYRLGALGFLAGGTGPDRIPPNLGLRDQQLAMRWVRANAAEFGGDPQRITLVGESAGAMSIGAHLIPTSTSAALFHGAIMESNPYGIPFKTAAQASKLRTQFDSTQNVLACTAPTPPGSLACLRSLTWEQILQSQNEVSTIFWALGGQLTGLLTWAPQLDGRVVPMQPNQAAITKPVIAGTNRDEGTLFAYSFPFTTPVSPVAYQLALKQLFGTDDAAKITALPRYAPLPSDNRGPLSNIVNDYLFTCAIRHVLKTSTGPTYAYLFAHRPSFAVWPGAAQGCQPVTDGGQGRVCHSFELPYVFRNAVAVTTPATPSGEVPPGDAFTAEEFPIIGQFTDFWASFAARDVPLSALVPARWPRFGPRGTRQVIDAVPAITRDAALSCALWDQIGYDKGAALYRTAPLP